MQHEITLTETATGDHVATYHATNANLYTIAMHAADHACHRANHANDDPMRPRADDIAAAIRAGIGVVVWHAVPEHNHDIGTDVSVRRVVQGMQVSA